MDVYSVIPIMNITSPTFFTVHRFNAIVSINLPASHAVYRLGNAINNPLPHPHSSSCSHYVACDELRQGEKAKDAESSLF